MQVSIDRCSPENLYKKSWALDIEALGSEYLSKSKHFYRQ